MYLIDLIIDEVKLFSHILVIWVINNEILILFGKSFDIQSFPWSLILNWEWELFCFF